MIFLATVKYKIRNFDYDYEYIEEDATTEQLYVDARSEKDAREKARELLKSPMPRNCGRTEITYKIVSIERVDDDYDGDCGSVDRKMRHNAKNGRREKNGRRKNADVD